MTVWLEAITVSLLFFLLFTLFFPPHSSLIVKKKLNYTSQCLLNLSDKLMFLLT